jgi:hypothetical protein
MVDDQVAKGPEIVSDLWQIALAQSKAGGNSPPIFRGATLGDKMSRAAGQPCLANRNPAYAPVDRF